MKNLTLLTTGGDLQKMLTLHKILTIAEEYIPLTRTNIYSLVFYLSRNYPISYSFNFPEIRSDFSFPEIHSDDINRCLHFLKINSFLTESEGIIKVQNKYKFTEFSEARLLHDNISKFEYLIDGRYLKKQNYLNISTALYVYRSLIQAKKYFTLVQYLEKCKQFEQGKVRFKDSELKYMLNKLCEIEPTKYFI